MGRSDFARSFAQPVGQSSQGNAKARRKGMGEEAIQHCRSYALEAERKMGEMLLNAAMEGILHVGGRPKTTGKVSLPVSEKQTLAQIGVTKNESAKAQVLASIPRASFDAVITGKTTRAKAVSEIRNVARKERLKSMAWPIGF